MHLPCLGSPYLLAHGLGKPVANAKTEAEFPAPGSYRLWVRTMDWVPSHHPGRFKVVVAGTEIAATFGEQGDGWMWQDGGAVEIKEKTVAISMKNWFCLHYIQPVYDFRGGAKRPASESEGRGSMPPVWDTPSAAPGQGQLHAVGKRHCPRPADPCRSA